MRRTAGKASLFSSFTVALAMSIAWACADTPTNKKTALDENDKRTAINRTMEWGRLAAFPENAKELVVTTEGNMFTRSFRVSFSASQEEIARWITESPGLRETQPKLEGSLRKYDIKPGGGAVHAEVVIDDSNNQVRVYVAWS
jgi:hypothetical protein